MSLRIRAHCRLCPRIKTLKALSSWKKINVDVATENSDLNGFGFGGLEVLDDYEILPFHNNNNKDLKKKKNNNQGSTTKQQQGKKKKKLSCHDDGTIDVDHGDDASYHSRSITNTKEDTKNILLSSDGEKRSIGGGNLDDDDDDDGGDDLQHKRHHDYDDRVEIISTTAIQKKPSKQSRVVQVSDGKMVKRKQTSLATAGGEVKRKKGQDGKVFEGKQTPELEPETQTESEPIDVNVQGMEGWKGLFVPPPVLKALKELGFTAPTLIQALALPSAIRDRQDILGAAETGSGKTLAFGIPVIEKAINWKQDDTREQEGVCALILTPTRELCIQVRDHLTKAAMYTDLKVVAVMGGLALHKQLRLLKAKPEIVVATPGRLWDIMNGEQEEVGSYLSTVVQAPMLVIDEADKMVEKGHFEELTKILTLMKGDEGSRWKRQSFVFSATLTYVHLAPDRLSKKKKKKKRRKGFQISKESKLDELIETVGILKRPKVIDITQKSQTASQLVESCIFCTHTEKDLYLYYFLQRHPGRTLIFTNSIDCIRRLVSLFSLLKKSLLPLHANMIQKQRLKNLEKFAANDAAVLVATDVAARGLDIPNVQHVIHYQIPRTSESYVHRSGRTARALKDGLSVMIVDEKEISSYRKIVKSLEKDDDLSTFPVDQSDLRLLKPVVSLAQRIDSAQHRRVKVKREEDWFTKMAKEADLGSSDDAGSDLDQGEVQREDLKAKRNLEKMKSELADILAQGAFSTHSYRGKYPTTGGKLQVPKNVNTKKETRAITLVSRKRRM